MHYHRCRTGPSRVLRTSSLPRGGPRVLGSDLNRSESRRGAQPSRAWARKDSTPQVRQETAALRDLIPVTIGRGSMRRPVEFRDRAEVLDPCLLRANKYLPAWHQFIPLAH
jgi:hypothetical protein